jgi:hypothetical protein
MNKRIALKFKSTTANGKNSIGYICFKGIIYKESRLAG